MTDTSRISAETLDRLASDAFAVFNWARRMGMAKDRQIEETVKAFEVALGYRSAPADEPDALKPGDSGDEVTALQSDLHALGFGIEVTSVFDDQTRVTVEEFQKALAMVPHGFATKATRERLAELVRCNRAEH